MAVALNKNRMRYSRIILALVFLLAVLTRSMYPDDVPVHEFNDLLGMFLVVCCMMGRVYSSLFIGGIKNEELITEGPYSMVRNPLYFFSFLGVVGIGFISNQVSLLLLLLVSFFAIYLPMIRREENFLLEKFGETFAQYRAQVPMLLPNPALYRSPAEVTVRPRFVLRAIFDSLWWLAPLAMFELFEYLREAGLITPVMKLF